MRRFLLLLPLLFFLIPLPPAHASPVPRVGPASPIRHVVDIFLENHSFDSILGFWCNAPQNLTRCPDGSMPSQVTLADGSVIAPATLPDLVPWVDHFTSAQNLALTNNWDQIGGCSSSKSFRCVGGWRPYQIPNLTTLASYFAISDMTFSQQNSPSWFGHLDAVAATTNGFTGDNPWRFGHVNLPGWGCDSHKVANWAPSLGAPTTPVPSCIPAPASLGLVNNGAFRPTPVPPAPTIMDRLDSAGLSWRIYGATSSPSNSNGYGMWDICPSFAECLYTPQSSNLVPDSQFNADASSGTLPSFSVVTPGGSDFMASGHNSEYMSVNDNWVGSLVSSVMNGPDWSSTAIFITYDDCGCFYDQVSPPATLNASGTPAGPRVPLIIVSPFSRPGYTDTTPTTFAGILAFTEHIFGLAPLTADDASAYDFSSAFDFSQPPLRSVRLRQARLTPAIRSYDRHSPRSLLTDPT